MLTRNAGKPLAPRLSQWIPLPRLLLSHHPRQPHQPPHKHQWHPFVLCALLCSVHLLCVLPTQLLCCSILRHHGITAAPIFPRRPWVLSPAWTIVQVRLTLRLRNFPSQSVQHCAKVASVNKQLHSTFGQHRQIDHYYFEMRMDVSIMRARLLCNKSVTWT